MIVQDEAFGGNYPDDPRLGIVGVLPKSAGRLRTQTYLKDAVGSFLRADFGATYATTRRPPWRDSLDERAEHHALSMAASAASSSTTPVPTCTGVQVRPWRHRTDLPWFLVSREDE